MCGYQEHEALCDRLKELLRQHSGQIHLNKLSELYENHFGEEFKTPNGLHIKFLIEKGKSYCKYFRVSASGTAFCWKEVPKKEQPPDSVRGDHLASWPQAGGGAAALSPTTPPPPLRVRVKVSPVQLPVVAEQGLTRITTAAQLMQLTLALVAPGLTCVVIGTHESNTTVAILIKTADVISAAFTVDGSLLDSLVAIPAFTRLLDKLETVKFSHSLVATQALWQKAAAAGTMRGVLDTQLVAELLGLGPAATLDALLVKLSSKDKGDGGVSAAMKSAPAWIKALARLALAVETDALEVVEWRRVLAASTLRLKTVVSSTTALPGVPVVYVDEIGALGSVELWQSTIKTHRPLEVHLEIEPLLALVPGELFGNRYACALDGFTHKLIEIVMDVGQRPVVFRRGVREREYLHPNKAVIVTQAHLNAVSGQLRVGFDNRAGIDGTLHRISFIPSRDATYYIGATLRVGRHVTGNVEFLRDLLVQKVDGRMRSILILGSPGTGKTTIVREVARVLSVDMLMRTLIIDTSNEIAGDGDVVHRSVGHARRMMVRQRDHQPTVMLEGIQNHTPEVMIIDEISRTKEVEAASTAKERGVAIVGSAHGDNFAALLRNKELKGLLGGSMSVMLGDKMAGSADKKVQIKRQHSPIFDTVILLKRDRPHAWIVYKDVAAAVDSIYARKPYAVETRLRDAETGSLYVAHEWAVQEEDLEGIA